MTGWESTERVLDSGGFESRQRVLVPEPMVEASEAGARTLGVTYWQAVDRLTRGGVRASWSGGGGKLKLLGGADSAHLRPARARLRRRRRLVPPRDPRRPARAPSRRLGDARAARSRARRQELSVTVEEYLPRLAARAGAPRWTGALYIKGQSPFHAAVSRRYFDLLVRSRP